VLPATTAYCVAPARAGGSIATAGAGMSGLLRLVRRARQLPTATVWLCGPAALRKRVASQFTSSLRHRHPPTRRPVILYEGAHSRGAHSQLRQQQPLTLRPGECTTVNYKSIGPRVCHASSAGSLAAALRDSSYRAAEQLSRPAEQAASAGKVRACRGGASPHPAGYLGQVDVLT
jgi:hypothetical protein